MSSPARSSYRSAGHEGFLPELRADPRHVLAHKRVQQIDVHFAAAAEAIATPEGLVQAAPGDAIVTGVGGERWPVPGDRFAAKYRPVPPTRAGEAGRYVSLPYPVLALPMVSSFEVLLLDGASRLYGDAGDWLVDYGDGSLGIVAAAVFPATYDIVG